MTQPCEYLEWDSEFFGLRIAKYRSHILREDGLRAAERWCFDERIDCLYLLADSSDAQSASLAEANGFRFVDGRILLDAKVDVSRNSDSIRAAGPADRDALQKIARVSHYDSRFFFDLRFPRSRVEDLYAAWIERRADALLLVEAEGKVAGYVTCHFDANHGSIGLLAVDEERRGRGLGRQLLAGAMRVFEAAGVRTATVVTQARNVASQRLYQSCGFRTRTVQFWFHRWFT